MFLKDDYLISGILDGRKVKKFQYYYLDHVMLEVKEVL